MVTATIPVPAYASISIWGAVILAVVRVIKASAAAANGVAR